MSQALKHIIEEKACAWYELMHGHFNNLKLFLARKSAEITFGDKLL
jgi:hypothetical protein